jgi:hypothetical protein
MNPYEWILGRDTGTSSKTIWAVMMKAVNKGDACTESSITFDVPHDVDDFGRCYRLLALFPEWRGRLDEVSKIFVIWTPYIREWNKLEKLYNKYLITKDGAHYSKSSAEYKLFSAMWNEFCDFIRELEHEGRLLDGWVCHSGSRGAYDKVTKDSWKSLQLPYCKKCENKCKFEVKEK